MCLVVLPSSCYRATTNSAVGEKSRISRNMIQILLLLFGLFLSFLKFSCSSTLKLKHLRLINVTYFSIVSAVIENHWLKTHLNIQKGVSAWECCINLDRLFSSATLKYEIEALRKNSQSCQNQLTSNLKAWRKNWEILHVNPTGVVFYVCFLEGGQYAPSFFPYYACHVYENWCGYIQTSISFIFN